MTDVYSNATSVPSSPVSQKAIHLEHPSVSLTADGDRASKLEELRLQLQQAKIPVSKRGSIAELPQSAPDCQLLPGTTRCSLPLCEDSCAERHAHHRTHARPLPADAPLIFSRPSISMAQGLGSVMASPLENTSPAGSQATSTTTSPHQQYRRASSFGFHFGSSNPTSNRGSIIMSGMGTPADMASSPPSPIGESDSSALSSAANSPRGERPQQMAHMASSLAPDFSQPIAEESKLEVDTASPHRSAAEAAAAAGPLASEYVKLGNRIIHVPDYAPGVLGIDTAESRSRRDLIAAPRDDFYDQSEISSFFDCRSPGPPSPLEMGVAEVMGVNVNQQDNTKPEIEYIIKPQ